MIEREWSAVVKGNNPTEIWQNKIRHLRRYLKGWARNRSGRYKKENEHVASYY
jgi:hypothetical protein